MFCLSKVCVPRAHFTNSSPRQHARVARVELGHLGAHRAGARLSRRRRRGLAERGDAGVEVIELGLKRISRCRAAPALRRILKTHKTQ
jgi:hypothetical protein